MLQRKIKPVRETRWIERHTALTECSDLYIPPLHCLETIGTWKCRDSKFKTKANGLLHQIQSSDFIFSLQTAAYTFGYTIKSQPVSSGSCARRYRVSLRPRQDSNELQRVRDKPHDKLTDIWHCCRWALYTVWNTKQAVILAKTVWITECNSIKITNNLFTVCLYAAQSPPFW